MNERWMRHGAALVVSQADTLTIVGSDGVARRFEGASADLIRAALEFWSAPHTEAELVEHLRALAGECDPALVAETAECLRAAGAIRAYEASSLRRPAANARAATRARIVLGISGAIAAIDAPALVRMLQARRFDVAVVMTAAARKFVSAGSLEALTHRPVIRGFWQKDAEGPAPHIQLATWADLVVLYPATAATISRIAQAACTDVLSALVTATTQPVLVVPSMNESMYLSPGVQRNLEQLRRDGRHVVQPVMGLEAAVAPSARTPMSGAAPPPSQVVAAIELLADEATRGKRTAATPVVGAEAWDRQYESSSVGDLPWFTEQLDADLARELGTVKRGRLLDVGTGPGTAAIFAARNGFDVVATDVSSTALGIARRRANGERIAWVLDDFLDSRLWGRFDVLVDRGCLHCLPKTSWPDYARTAGKLVEPGGTLLLKVHAPEEAGRHGTNPAGPDELRAVFGEWFSLVGTHASEFDGTIRPSPKALLVVLARTEPTGAIR
jgi:SAM-dependent methyltransferase/3-polyprenyl-4-hydroxybenzoate decarboxylase